MVDEAEVFEAVAVCVPEAVDSLDDAEGVAIDADAAPFDDVSDEDAEVDFEDTVVVEEVADDTDEVSCVVEEVSSEVSEASCAFM
jgi:hypothetical protein